MGTTMSDDAKANWPINNGEDPVTKIRRLEAELERSGAEASYLRHVMTLIAGRYGACTENCQSKATGAFLCPYCIASSALSREEG